MIKKPTAASVGASMNLIKDGTNWRNKTLSEMLFVHSPVTSRKRIDVKIKNITEVTTRNFFKYKSI
jgi:hypothetical protein